MRTAKIPETVFELGLSPHALVLYAVLLIHRSNKTGTAWPGTVTMKKMSGIGINQLKARITELTEHGLIEFHCRRKPSNVDEYTVFLPDDKADMDSLESDSKEGGWIHHSVEMDSLNSDRGTIRNQRYEPTIDGADFCESKSEKKPNSKLAVESCRVRVGECVRRKPSTEWSDQELSKLRKLTKRQDFAAELDTIHAAYTSPPSNIESDYRRRGLGALLDSWPGELDKCFNGQLFKINGNRPSQADQLAGMKRLGT